MSSAVQAPKTTIPSPSLSHRPSLRACNTSQVRYMCASFHELSSSPFHPMRRCGLACRGPHCNLVRTAGSSGSYRELLSAHFLPLRGILAAALVHAVDRYRIAPRSCLLRSEKLFSDVSARTSYFSTRIIRLSHAAPSAPPHPNRAARHAFSDYVLGDCLFVSIGYSYQDTCCVVIAASEVQTSCSPHMACRKSRPELEICKVHAMYQWYVCCRFCRLAQHTEANACSVSSPFFHIVCFLLSMYISCSL